MTLVPIAKSKGSLKAVGAAVAGGSVGSVLANQIPQNQNPSHLSERLKKHRHKSKVKKIAYEDYVYSDDPEFNHGVAKLVFDQIMKMDDDTAEVFSEMVVGEIYETTVEKNLRVLQRHLNEVIAKRLEDTKSAVLRTVAKGHTEGSMETAAALEQLEEIIKAGNRNPYTTGHYQFDESDFRRDPGSGQFVLKVKHNQTNPYPRKVASGMGLLPDDKADRQKYGQLTTKQKAQFQDEYRQLAQFLDMVTSSTGSGDTRVHLRVQDKSGNEFRREIGGDPNEANKILLNPNRTLLAVEATPATLTAGGAAFGLAHALGAGVGPNTGGRIGMADRAESNFSSFSSDWIKPTEDMKSSNERLYNKVNTAGTYLGQVAPPGSKAYMASRVATAVGSHGAEAEAVLGPGVRRTAYRYRGTEKTPDKHIVGLYGRAISAAKSTGGDPDDELPTTPRGGGRPEGELASRRATRVNPSGSGPVAPAPSQMATAREKADNRPPNRSELAVGRRIIQDQLRVTLPQGSLYNLQAESGNLPPSEGILLNAKGQIVTQAVGYGDDHYLPFNLKNLKALKGGEYVRTRSVGGLTSEDIYTGLITGARRVTVVSRSGTFSVEFESDFRGGRRYNDKALRMTRRYEQLLDAVQSNKVTRAPVPDTVVQAIRQEVAQDYPYVESRAALKAKIDQRIKEYREDPDIGPEDERILRLVYEQGMKDNQSRDANEWMKTARGLVMEGKQFNYQLDASGYEAAQNALQEQFPYYIKSLPVIEKEGRPVSREKDKGYVEPGRIRPTAPREGLFGTAENAAAGEQVGDRKFSASQVDYQRGRIGPGRGDRSPNSPTPPRRAATADPAEPGTPGTPGATPAVSQARNKLVLQNAAVQLFTEIKRVGVNEAIMTPQQKLVLSHDLGSFASSIGNDEDRKKFEAMLDPLRGDLDSATDSRLVAAWGQYKRAHSAMNATPSSAGTELYWSPSPQQFIGAGYGPSDTDEQRAALVQQIDRRTRAITTGGSLSELAAVDGGLQREHDKLSEIRIELQADPSIASNLEAQNRVMQAVFGSKTPPSREAGRILQSSEADIRTRMTDVQRMRTIHANHRGTWPPTAAPGSSPGPAGGSSGGTPAGFSPPPDPNDPLAGLSHPSELPTAGGTLVQLKSRDDVLAQLDHARSELIRKGSRAVPADDDAKDELSNLLVLLSNRSDITDPAVIDNLLRTELTENGYKWYTGEHYNGRR